MTAQARWSAGPVTANRVAATRLLKRLMGGAR